MNMRCVRRSPIVDKYTCCPYRGGVTVLYIGSQGGISGKDFGHLTTASAIERGVYSSSGGLLVGTHSVFSF